VSNIRPVLDYVSASHKVPAYSTDTNLLFRQAPEYHGHPGPSPTNRGLSDTRRRSILAFDVGGSPQTVQQSDALATVTSTGDECLYGGSSTIAFVRHVAGQTPGQGSLQSSASRRKANVTQQVPLVSPTVGTSPDIILGRNERVALLPHRRSADNYLHCFWEFVHPVFPVLHKTSFMSRYEALWLPEPETPRNGSDTTDVEDVMFTSNLNLVFALGCQYSGRVPSTQKTAMANDFYQRARHLFLFDILDSTSISIVQMLLLTGIYLQSTRSASRCWNSVGLAIRVAQSLGLHLDYAGLRPESQLKKEMRRRIWHTCVVLDK